MSRVALLFPTGTDPRSPYLGLPCLAANLRAAGIVTDLYDLDIGGVHALLDRATLAEAGARVRQAVDRQSPLWRLALRSEALPGACGDALNALRDERFYDPNEYNRARQTLYDGLDLVSAAASRSVRYGISPIRYDMDGIDPQSLPDLVRATADDSGNLFAAWWERWLYPALARDRPLFAGIAINNRQQALPGLLLARRLRERGHYVVIGGALFTKFAGQFTRMPEFFDIFANAVIAYEGETASVELAAALEAGRGLENIPNLLWKHRGLVRVNRTHVEDVTRLPCPDFAGMPLEQYLTPEPVLPVYFGKGCYFNRCKFCDIPYINHISSKAYRLRTVDQIADDLHTLHARFSCRHFEITDEALPPRFLEHLADALEPCASERFCFVGYGRLERGFTAQVCRKIARMGMKKLFFGLESGAQETLDHMDKGIRLSDVPGVLQNCHNSGIRVHIFSIIGFPGETEKRARETYAFFERNAAVLDHPGNSFDIHPFGLELRTAYFAEAESMGAFISPAALSKEFVVGVGQDWFNAYGLTHEEVRRLTAEFNAGLKALFHRYHAAPEHLWPGFEEYSVLYADHYDGAPFPYRTSLPEGEELDACAVRWSAAIAVESEGDTMCIRSRYAEIRVSAGTYRLIGETPPGELIRRLREEGGETEVDVRNRLDTMLSRGLLEFVPLPITALAAGGGR